MSLPSNRKTLPLVAPVSVVAAAAIASKVGWTSVGELEMTRRISAVAVWRSSASRVSVNSRAFSIAMTACAAKFCNSAICFVREWPHLLAIDRRMWPSSVPSLRSGTISKVRTPAHVR